MPKVLLRLVLLLEQLLLRELQVLQVGWWKTSNHFRNIPNHNQRRIRCHNRMLVQHNQCRNHKLVRNWKHSSFSCS